MIRTIKNTLSKIDRLLGYRFWLILWSFRHFDTFEHYCELPLDELKVYFPNLDEQDHKSKKYHTSLGQSYIIQLSTSYVEGGTGWVYNYGIPHPMSYPYAAYPWRQIFYPHLVFHPLKILLSPKKKFRRAVNLIWHGWSNYYHFFIDILPILNLLEETYEEVEILVPDTINTIPFIRDFLNLYPDRYQSLKFKYIRPDEIVKVDKLILASRSRFHSLPNHKPKHSKGAERVFLMRPLEGQRTITNLKELTPILDEYEFNVIDTSYLSLQEQMDVFKDVVFLVGIHGAGMTNLIFSEKLKFVIELFPGKMFKPLHYKHLSQMKGDIVYEQLTGSGTATGTNGHFELPPLELKNALGKYLDN